MTQEEKAKRYDEALERAKKLYEQGTITESLNNVFPELAESEDERIRKSIIAIINNYVDNSNTFKSKMLAWLEKQGDTNETINNDELAQSVLRGAAINLITWIDYNAAEGNMCLSNVQCREIENALVKGDWNKIYAYMKKKLERQDEQKHKDSPLEGILIHGNNDAYRLGYKKAIEKACKWLEERQIVDLEVPNIEKFIDDFKKAMEE